MVIPVARIDDASAHSFDIGLFMPMLQERILVKDSAVRGLNVGWIQVLDSIPGIDLLRYLPGVLPGLFGMTADPNAATVAAAEEMLSEFLNEFKASQPDTIEKLVGGFALAVNNVGFTLALFSSPSLSTRVRRMPLQLLS